jgi:hypothetical protein
MLAGEGDADDGEEEQETEDKVADGEPESTEDQPDDIQQKTQTTSGGRAAYGFTSKRPEYKAGEFEALKSEGYTNDGQAEGEATYHIKYGSIEPAKDQPDQVAECIHDSNNQ